jgi:hypothetical protein
MPAFSRAFFSSALASAERTSFASGRATRLLDVARMPSASSTCRPRIWSTTRRTFCALIR